MSHAQLVPESGSDESEVLTVEGSTRTSVRPVLVVAVVLVIVLSACAPGANPEVGTAASAGGDPAGFWLGLWQGLIAPITFVVSLFDDGVGIYEVHNSGNLYNFGYVLGLGFIVGGSSASSRR